MTVLKDSAIYLASLKRIRSKERSMPKTRKDSWKLVLKVPCKIREISISKLC